MIDLHTHSACSDGSESPGRVAELAHAAGLSAVALTDHDTFRGIAPAAARATALGIRLVEGCEVSCAYEERTVHVLCYFVGSDASPLGDELARLRDDRVRRNERMVTALRELGLPLTMAAVEAKAQGSVVGRPHMAAVLVDAGAAASVNDAFSRYLARGRPGYVAKARLTVEEVGAVAHASGGTAVLAHPLSLDLAPEALTRVIDAWAGAIDGVECEYGRYDEETRARLRDIARARDLVATGGSDFHGAYKPDLVVGTGRGDLRVPDEVLDELAARAPR